MKPLKEFPLWLKATCIVADALLVWGLLTSCGSSKATKPTESPLPDGGGTPTMPLPNTETPTATATPTETPTPSPTATYSPDQIKQLSNTEIIGAAPEAEGLEKFISPAGKHIVLYRNDKKEYTQAYNMITKEMVDVIHVSTDWEKPTKITMEDLTSGKLADSERLQCPGFSDKVIPGDWFYAKGDTIFSTVLMKYDPSRYSDPSVRPQKMCSYSEVNADLGRGEQPYIVMGLAVKNKDGSVGFVHRWGRPEDLPILLKLNNKNFGIITDEIRHTLGYPEGEFLDETRPEVETWALELESTDILPKEFERKLFSISVGTW